MAKQRRFISEVARECIDRFITQVYTHKHRHINKCQLALQFNRKQLRSDP